MADLKTDRHIDYLNLHHKYLENYTFYPNIAIFKQIYLPYLWHFVTLHTIIMCTIYTYDLSQFYTLAL